MKVQSEASHAPQVTIDLVQAIARYAKTTDEFIQIATKLWPQLRVYRGHTHLRLMTTGDPVTDSVCVEVD